MKKFLFLCLSLLLVLSLAACGGKADEPDTPPEVDTEEPQTPEPKPEPEPEPEPEPPIPFTDVPEDASCYDAVVWAYENGIVSDSSTFEPDSACTRAQVVTFLWRAAGSPEPQTTEDPFSDISSSAWYYKAALWGYQNNIITSTVFNPENLCTNGETLTFLWRARGRPIVLSMSDAYYARPVVWADQGGLFAELDPEFDPAAPCSRADFMTYLFWAMEEWALSEEDKSVQAEFERILYGSQTYAFRYANYVDMDNDGKVELLTLGCGYDYDRGGKWHLTVDVTVYANINGHVEKTCEGTGRFQEGQFSLSSSDGQIFLHYKELAGSEENDSFYTIEEDVLTLADQFSKLRSSQNLGRVNDKVVRLAEYQTELNKYEDITGTIFNNYNGRITTFEQGVRPNEDECVRYWTTYWASDPTYAVVLNGDFSSLAGTYKSADGQHSITLNIDGTLTGREPYYGATTKPISVAALNDGAIQCVIVPEEYKENEMVGWCEGEYYNIYPVGFDSRYGSVVDTIRIGYTVVMGTDGEWDEDLYYKVS